MFLNKVILAPMVNVCSLPSRILCLRYGADLVYSDEIIDYGLLQTTRIENQNVNTTDFMNAEGRIIFKTNAEEKGRNILQLGTSCPKRALRAARLVEKDVAGIDVNMGCPKEFSTAFGMGAALMSNPSNAFNILKNLVDNLSIPVTCKIRVFPSLDDTLKFAELMASAGISAIAVHGRTKDERPRKPDRPEILRKISRILDIPVIANGGSGRISNYEDMLKFKEETECASVMVARAAYWNFSVFRREGPLPIEEVIKSYLKLAIELNAPDKAKFIIHHQFNRFLETEKGIALVKSQSFEDICAIWGLREEYLDSLKRLKEDYLTPLQEELLRVRREKESVIFELPIECTLESLKNNELPKTVLYKWAIGNEINPPLYKTENQDGGVKAVVKFNDVQYASNLLHKNKLFAEQAAALVCLKALDLTHYPETIVEKGQ